METITDRNTLSFPGRRGNAKNCDQQTIKFDEFITMETKDLFHTKGKPTLPKKPIKVIPPKPLPKPNIKLNCTVERVNFDPRQYVSRGKHNHTSRNTSLGKDRCQHASISTPGYDWHTLGSLPKQRQHLTSGKFGDGQLWSVGKIERDMQSFAGQLDNDVIASTGQSSCGQFTVCEKFEHDHHFLPVVLGQQTSPAVLGQQTSHAVLDQQSLHAVLGHQASPIVLGQQTSPVILSQQTSPIVLGQQTTPEVIGRKTSPVVLGQQTSPIVLGQQTSHVVLGQQTSPIFLGQQTSPILLGQQTSPAVIGIKTSLVVLGQQTLPMVIGQQTTSVVQGQQTSPTVLGQQTPHTVLAQQTSPIILGQQTSPAVLGQQTSPTVLGQQTSHTVLGHQASPGEPGYVQETAPVELDQAKQICLIEPCHNEFVSTNKSGQGHQTYAGEPDQVQVSLACQPGLGHQTASGAPSQNQQHLTGGPNGGRQVSPGRQDNQHIIVKASDHLQRCSYQDHDAGDSPPHRSSVAVRHALDHWTSTVTDTAPDQGCSPLSCAEKSDFQDGVSDLLIECSKPSVVRCIRDDLVASAEEDHHFSTEGECVLLLNVCV